MAQHTTLSAEQAADRLAIRELFDAYARCADRRDSEGQKALFTVDTRFAVYMGGEGTEPTYVIDGREELTPIFEDLRQYKATMHFNGQQTITLAGDSATGECYTIAHHLTTDGDQQQVMVAHLRYHDRYTKTEGVWLFAARDLIVDWTETRPSAA